MHSTLTVSAPSRLHFGLFSVGAQAERQFGGLGMMIESPRTIIEVENADRLEIQGPSDDTCRRALECWFDRLENEINTSPKSSLEVVRLQQLPAKVRISSISPRHCGLGSGTQLALASAMAISEYFGISRLDPGELATTVRRGNRSAIGTYGFFQGGLLVDRGRSRHDRIAPLDFRTDFPQQWAILLVLKRDLVGLSGSSESEAFKTLPPVKPEKRQAMVRLVRDRIIPAVMQEDFDSFANSLFDFGFQSGQFFAAVQGGAYHGKQVTEMVNFVRELGFQAVGQSSWGPCIFVIARHHEEAARCSESLVQRYGDQIELIHTRADNRGATVTSSLESSQISTR